MLAQMKALGKGGKPPEAEEEMLITNKLGLNLRMAAELVKVASRFKSRISVGKDGHSTDGKSLLGLISLAVECGAMLKFKACGDDAQEALDAVRRLVGRKFGEKE